MDESNYGSSKGHEPDLRRHIFMGMAIIRRATLGMAIFLSLTCPAPGRGALPFSETENAVLTVYLDAELTPSAEIKVERIFKTYEKRGFFRIGALPLMVADNVQIKLMRPQALAKALATVRETTSRSRHAGRFEMRRLEIVSATPGGNRLRADSARFDEEGRCKLRGVVQIQTGTNSVNVSTAILQATGPQAGTVQWTDKDRDQTVVLWR